VPWLLTSRDAVVERLAPAAPRRWSDGGHAQHANVSPRRHREQHARTQRANAQGKRHTTNPLGKGLLSGLIAPLDGSPLIHDVCARGASSIEVVPRDAILSTMQARPMPASTARSCYTA
jgi:hypothetical protein